MTNNWSHHNLELNNISCILMWLLHTAKISASHLSTSILMKNPDIFTMLDWERGLPHQTLHSPAHMWNTFTITYYSSCKYPWPLAKHAKLWHVSDGASKVHHEFLSCHQCTSMTNYTGTTSAYDELAQIKNKKSSQAIPNTLWPFMVCCFVITVLNSSNSRSELLMTSIQWI